jgi:hypothetical protein
MSYKTNWLSTDFLSASEMNRIENNINLLAIHLRSIQYQIPSLEVKTNRTRVSIDYLSDINRIEQNLEVLRLRFLTPPNYLEAKVWTKVKTFDYNDANRLEANTQLMREYADRVVSSFRYCGAINAGGGGVY